MLAYKKILIEEQLFLQEACIGTIEEKLDNFFSVRFQSIQSIIDLYIKGNLKSSGDILKLISITEADIKGLVETIEYTINREIIQNDSLFNTKINGEGLIGDMEKSLDGNLDEMLKTERITGFYEKVLHESVAIIIDTYTAGKLINYLLKPANISANILGCLSQRKQKRKHGEIILQQVHGNLLNLKSDLRNKLVKSVLSFAAAFDDYSEESIVA